MVSSIKPRLNAKSQLRSRNISLHITASVDDIEQPIKSDVLPILVNHESDTELFQLNWNEYKQNLNTKVLGQAVIYADVMTSTMQAFDGYVSSSYKTWNLGSVINNRLKQPIAIV